jgi:hypothetical protein
VNIDEARRDLVDAAKLLAQRADGTRQLVDRVVIDRCPIHHDPSSVGEDLRPRICGGRHGGEVLRKDEHKSREPAHTPPRVF